MDAFQSSQQFQPYLFNGERILWTVQTETRPRAQRQGHVPHPVQPHVVWFRDFLRNAMVCLAPFDTNSGGNPGCFFKLWGLPFLVIGLYLIVGRFLHDAHIQKVLFLRCY